jgi:hypothetical protein
MGPSMARQSRITVSFPDDDSYANNLGKLRAALKPYLPGLQIRKRRNGVSISGPFVNDGRGRFNVVIISSILYVLVLLVAASPPQVRPAVGPA